MRRRIAPHLDMSVRPPYASGMDIDTLIETPEWKALPLAQLAKSAGRATLAELGLDPKRFSLSLLACNDARIATLNADFRGKPVPTNVLSWPSEERYSREGALPLLPNPSATSPIEELGDIALSWQTCLREAEEAGKPMADHVTHLIVHGILHLLGFDHLADADATLMEGFERRILARLGVPDPY